MSDAPTVEDARIEGIAYDELVQILDAVPEHNRDRILELLRFRYQEKPGKWSP